MNLLSSLLKFTANQIARLDGRVDDVVSAATVDSEVIDIRNGLDGTHYTSAGAAVRGQYAQIQQRITSLNNSRVLDISNLQAHKVAQPLDEYNQPTDGTDGQLLRTKGDGSTEWVDEGLPTDEQTAQAVSDWLDEHPEATTTVQDHSLTHEKLVNGTLGYVTPEMFGAKGNGTTNDSIAFQTAIDSKLPIFLNNGSTYLIDSIILSSDTVIVGFGDAVLKPSMKDGSTTRYNTMFVATSGIDIYFDGIVFEGYDEIEEDTSLQETLFKFSNLNKLTICNCVFECFQQPDATDNPAYVDRTGCVITGIDVKETIIKGCTFRKCVGDEMIWIVPKTLDREDMNLMVRDNLFESNGVTVIDFIGNNAFLSGNQYVDISPSSSGINIFALNVFVSDETWRGDECVNIYDFTEGGRFHSKYISISNVVVDVYVHDEYNTAYVIGSKSIQTFISNCSAKKCDQFVRRFGVNVESTESHKDIDTTDIPKMDMIISDSEINYKKYVLGGAVYINASESVIRIQDCNITCIDYDTFAGSLIYMLNERYYICKNNLSVRLNSSSSYSVIDLALNDTRAYALEVRENIVDHKSQNNSYFFSGGDVACRFIENRALGSTIRNITDDLSNSIFKLANNISYDNYIVKSGALVNGNYKLSLPTWFDEGTVIVRNTTLSASDVFTFEVNKSMYRNGDVLLRYKTDNRNIAIGVGATGIILYVFVGNSADYATDANTVLELIY